MQDTQTTTRRRTLPPPPKAREPQGPGQRIVAILGSYGLAVGILCALLVITFLGTMEQRFRGIHDVQQDYFESFVYVSRTLGATAEHPQSGFPIPVIGALPLLCLLFVNLLVGGMLRMRKRRSTIGVLIAHIGIAVLLLGGLVEHLASTHGSMRIDPGGTSDAFTSYYDWDVVVSEFLPDGSAREYIVPQEQFSGTGSGDAAHFHHALLPFDLVLSGYARNARPIPAGEPSPAGAAEGFLLEPLDPENKAERNLPGVLAGVPRKGGPPDRTLLWGGESGGYVFERDGRSFSLDLRRRSWKLPFQLRLKRFVKADHPGISMAREFSSYVQKLEDGSVQDIHITMNEPLRHRGYIFYQSSYDPVGRSPNGETVYATILTVSVNPADRVPLIACVIIGIGLLLHFVQKLFRHIQAESGRRTRVSVV